LNKDHALKSSKFTVASYVLSTFIFLALDFKISLTRGYSLAFLVILALIISALVSYCANIEYFWHYSMLYVDKINFYNIGKPFTDLI